MKLSRSKIKKIREDHPTPQQTFRQKEAEQNITRQEIPMNKEDYEKFMEIVEEVADEHPTPVARKYRIKQAKIQLFSEFINKMSHDYFLLKEQIKLKNDEIKAMAPTYFKLDDLENVQLTEAVKALPDDPVKLKKLITRLHKAGNEALEQAKKYKAIAERRSQNIKYNQ